MHGIAFKFKGWLYAQKQKLGNLKTRAVIEGGLVRSFVSILDIGRVLWVSLNLEPRLSFDSVLERKKGFDLNLRAALAIKTVNNFLASHDREIVLAHVPLNNDVSETSLAVLKIYLILNSPSYFIGHDSSFSYSMAKLRRNIASSTSWTLELFGKR